MPKAEDTEKEMDIMTNTSILVVEDDDASRELVVGCLEAQGYQMSAVTSGEEAVPYLDRRDLDLVITDLKMPGMNGLTLAEKALRADPDRPVILMTAFADVTNVRKSISIGIYDFIVKPFHLSDFRDAVRRALNHRRLVVQNREYQRNLERMVEERTRELQGRTQELQEALNKLDRKVKELEARDQINQLLLTIQTPRKALSTVLEAVQSALGVERVVIFLSDASGQKPEPATGVGVESPGELASSEILREFSDPWMEKAGAAATQAFREGRAVYEEGPSGRGSAAVPMLRLGEVLGVVFVQNPFSGRSLGEEDLQTLVSLTAQAAVAVSDARLYGDSAQWKATMENLRSLLPHR